MKSFEDHFIDQFEVKPIELKYKKNKKRIIFRTPDIDYCFSYEGWKKFKDKINKV